MVHRFTQDSRKLGLGLLAFVRSQTKNPLFWRESFLLILANIIVTSLGLIRTPLITWTIPKEQVGMLGVIASWMPFLQLASLTGLDTASYHYTSKGQPWALIINITHRLRWSILSAAGLLCGAIYWAWQREPGLAWLFIIAGISYPLTAGLSAVSGTLGAQERYKALFWYRIWESLTDFTGFIPLVFSTWWVNQIVTFYGANQLATLIMQVGYSIWIIIPIYKARTNRLSQQEEKELIRYGKHQTVINGISVLNSRIDAVLVSIFLPLNTMADYSIALLVYEQLKRLWNVYITIRYPKLVRMPLLELWRQFLREGMLVLLGFSGLGIALAVAGYWLIPHILPSSYTTSLGFIVLLILAFLVSLPAGITDTYFRTQQDHKPQYFLRFTGVIIGLIASLLLLPRWGAYGVASGKILAALAQSAMGTALFLKNSPKS